MCDNSSQSAPPPSTPQQQQPTPGEIGCENITKRNKKGATNRKPHKIPDINDANLSLKFFMWLREWACKENVVALFSEGKNDLLAFHLADKLEAFKWDPLVFYTYLDESKKMKLLKHYHMAMSTMDETLAHRCARIHFARFTPLNKTPSKAVVTVHKDLVYSKCKDRTKDTTIKGVAQWANKFKNHGKTVKHKRVEKVWIVSKRAWNKTLNSPFKEEDMDTEWPPTKLTLENVSDCRHNCDTEDTLCVDIKNEARWNTITTTDNATLEDKLVVAIMY